jgi:hypothetical protein
VLRAAEEAETAQGNIQDWFELDGDSGFQLLTEEGLLFASLIRMTSRPPIDPD